MSGRRFRIMEQPPQEPMATEIFGIPIRFDPYTPHVAIARGFFWNRHIVVGPKWAMMENRTAHAVALHEAKHCLAFHMEKRVIGFLLLCAPLLLLPLKIALAFLLFGCLFMLVEEWFSRQELEADAFAVDAGYGVELLRWVMQHPSNPPFYPSFDKRCKAIEQGPKGRASMGFFKRLFNLGIAANQATISGKRQPLAYFQYTTTGAAVKLTVPSVTAFPGDSIGYAVIQCIGAATTDYAAWRDDGVAPTPTVGMRLFSGQELDYTGDIYAIQWITGSGSPVLNITLYA